MSRKPPKKRRQPRHLNPKDPASMRGPGRSLGRRRSETGDTTAHSGGRHGRRQMREDLRMNRLEKLEEAVSWESKADASDRRNPERAAGADFQTYGTPRWARVIEAYRGHCLIKPLAAEETAQPRAELIAHHAADGRPAPEMDLHDPALPAATRSGLAAQWPADQYLRAGWRRVFEHYADLSRNLVCVGDLVRFVMTHEPAGIEDIAGVITDILQGEHTWERVAWGGRGVQRIVSNIDQLLMVVSVQNPDFRPGLIDRFICLAEYEDLPILIAINKWDLLPHVDPAVREPVDLPPLVGLSATPVPDLPPLTEEAAVADIEHDIEKEFKRAGGESQEEITADLERDLAVYEQMGYPIFRVSAATGWGLAALRDAMLGKITAVSGHSGVGKSSILSRMFPGIHLRVGEVSQLHGKGKHTTTNVTWIDRPDRLPGGTVVADTPGLRTFGLWGIRQPDLDYFFRDFRPFLGECKMPDCSHHHEPKCGVKTAVEAGRIDPRRYASFQRIYRSLPAV